MKTRCKYLGTLGDVNFIDYSGGPVFQEIGNPKNCWIEWVEPPADDDPKGEDGDYTVYRVDLDRLKWMVSIDDGKPYFVHDAVTREWEDRAPASQRQEWWMTCDGGIEPLCRSMDIPFAILADLLASDNPLDRARGYCELAHYHGWYEFDHDPLTLTRSECNKRYRNVPPRKRRRASA